MDPGSLSFPAAMVVMIGLLGAARISSGDEQNCICPEIPHRSQTQPPGKKCFGVGDRYRYTCLPGLVREAGTSNMIKCEQSDGRIYWTTPTLNCKPDPKLPTITVQTNPKRNTTQSPGSTVTNKNNCTCPEIPQWPLTQPPGETCFQINGTYRYTCLEGYVRKAGTSDLIKCTLTGSALVWTTPRLECIPNPKRNATQSPGSTVPTVTSSSPQTTWSISSLATVTVGTEREETTIHATSAPWSETTMASNQTDSNSTHSGFFGKNDILPKAHKGTVPAVCISILIVMVCALIGLYVLYRRKLKKNINSQQSAAQLEELQQLKG